MDAFALENLVNQNIHIPSHLVTKFLCNNEEKLFHVNAMRYEPEIWNNSNVQQQDLKQKT